MSDQLQKILKKMFVLYGTQNAEKLVEILYKKQKVNEFLIAEKLNLTINQTRNVLYKLLDEGLIGFVRKKDKKKGGWYVYFWSLKLKKALQKAKTQTKIETEKFCQELAERKKERYYYSPSIKVEYSEEEAMENNFICPETGEVLQLRDTTQLEENIIKEVKKNEDTLEEINSELKIVEIKEQKALEKQLRIEKEEKDERRRERKKERDKLKEKEKKATKKKTSKKIVKKKVVKKTSKKPTKKKVKKKVVKKKK